MVTGFVGTPYSCLVLSENGYSDISYQLLLNEDYPSWLYAVNQGATTVWERWNSVLPDGSMNPQGMNSLNHYAYGSILEWLYSNVLGISPLESNPGFKIALIRPQFSNRLGKVSGMLKTVNGVFEIEWEFKREDLIEMNIVIPFNTNAKLELPRGNISINGLVNHDEKLQLESGKYSLEILLSDR